MRLSWLGAFPLVYSSRFWECHRISEQVAERLDRSEDLELNQPVFSNALPSELAFEERMQLSVVENSYTQIFRDGELECDEVLESARQVVSQALSSMPDRVDDDGAAESVHNEVGTPGPYDSCCERVNYILEATRSLFCRVGRTRRIYVEPLVVPGSVENGVPLQSVERTLQRQRIARRVISACEWCTDSCALVYLGVLWLIIDTCYLAVTEFSCPIKTGLILIIAPIGLMFFGGCVSCLYLTRNFFPSFAIFRNISRRFAILRFRSVFEKSTLEDCAVCFIPLDSNRNTCCVLPCTHMFHSMCMVTWSAKPSGNTCPLCRAEYVKY